MCKLPSWAVGTRVSLDSMLRDMPSQPHCDATESGSADARPPEHNQQRVVLADATWACIHRPGQTTASAGCKSSCLGAPRHTMQETDYTEQQELRSNLLEGCAAQAVDNIQSRT